MTCDARYPRESDMYPAVVEWLERLLSERYPNAFVEAYDTHQVYLSRFLASRGLGTRFPDYPVYQIKVDVTGVILQKGSSGDYLAFVECKNAPISLKDVSQLLGYSRVALPIYSIIISPCGPGREVTMLLKAYRRLDVLEYARNRRLKIGTWIAERCEVDPASLLPLGEHF